MTDYIIEGGRSRSVALSPSAYLTVTTNAASTAKVDRRYKNEFLDQTAVSASTSQSFGPYNKQVEVTVSAVGANVTLTETDTVVESLTMTVVYDSGWPAARPGATNVLAIGHTSEPPWLTDDDLWFEAV
jgi:hypothetical protein